MILNQCHGRTIIICYIGEYFSSDIIQYNIQVVFLISRSLKLFKLTLGQPNLNSMNSFIQVDTGF